MCPVGLRKNFFRTVGKRFRGNPILRRFGTMGTL